jgi:V/A-type H+-transporting ATPase subunit A
MMTVVGEEGTSVEDFTTSLKAEFFDNVYLQQNAFDETDAATNAERQKMVFEKVLEVLELDFEFEDKDEARRILVRLTDRYRNWNYAPWKSEEYNRIFAEIDDFISRKGRRTR